MIIKGINNDPRDFLVLRLFSIATSVAFRSTVPGVINHSVFPEWNDFKRAEPMGDLKQIREAYGERDFGSTATAWMSMETLNWVLLNDNPADLRGTCAPGTLAGRSDFGLRALNALLAADKLSQVGANDEGAMVDGVYKPFVPDGIVLIVPSDLSAPLVVLSVADLNAGG